MGGGFDQYKILKVKCPCNGPGEGMLHHRFDQRTTFEIQGKPQQARILWGTVQYEFLDLSKVLNNF